MIQIITKISEGNIWTNKAKNIAANQWKILLQSTYENRVLETEASPMNLTVTIFVPRAYIRLHLYVSLISIPRGWTICNKSRRTTNWSSDCQHYSNPTNELECQNSREFYVETKMDETVQLGTHQRLVCHACHDAAL
ncbi:hypothetical protein T10_961 [Trichinella papuae]|uniref:Uncharacterized protein n=1 Tax=Trichinella papuae TaxID=268474 RepID=A0A0V1M6D9_9BILA|nr:hypothetical protein T10_961 [Trichinella papuae]